MAANGIYKTKEVISFLIFIYYATLRDMYIISFIFLFLFFLITWIIECSVRQRFVEYCLFHQFYRILDILRNYLAWKVTKYSNSELDERRNTNHNVPNCNKDPSVFDHFFCIDIFEKMDYTAKLFLQKAPKTAEVQGAGR